MIWLRFTVRNQFGDVGEEQGHVIYQIFDGKFRSKGRRQDSTEMDDSKIKLQE